MTWLLWTVVVLCLLAIGAFVLCGYGARRWSGSLQPLTRRLEAARVGGQAQVQFPTRYDVREIEGLPVPVQRYRNPRRPAYENFFVELSGNARPGPVELALSVRY